MPRDKWALKDDAVPRLFPNCPSTFRNRHGNARLLLADSPRQKASAEKDKIIKQFLDVLNVSEKNALEKGTKLLASQLTTESLRVTLLSTLDIISYLFNKDAAYVLTAKLNQDPWSGISVSHVHLEVMSRTLQS
ncbi:uncharacterized protein LOC142768833 isoform X1 [Rhipicephalus microplus]|uniref:uncharacterized protein LOC142768833 isoform X1 n=1 Tax=Rhipicephalus microplus TaxID=6941 RepID=UPI003F6BC893